MKTIKLKENRSKLVNIGVLKAKRIHCGKKHLNYISKKNFEFKFKNALNIIFKFHSENKKILFLGTPLTLNKKLKELFKNTNHSFIPEKLWLGGVLTNTKSIFKFLFKKYFKKSTNNLKFLFNLTNKNNLIVIMDESLSQSPLKEFTKKRIPTISVNYSNKSLLNHISATYKIKKKLSCNDNKNINKLFFSILFETLKKSEKIRIKNLKASLKHRKLNQNTRQFTKKSEFFKKK